MYKRSATTEKEHPKLDDQTRELIKAYRKSRTAQNHADLREKIGQNYDAVVAKKKAKLNELKRTAKARSKIKEMQEIIDDMIAARESRIDEMTVKISDPRLTPEAKSEIDGFLPIIGVAHNGYIAYAPVTSERYAKFCEQTGKKCPFVSKPASPAIYVSYGDATEYRTWLSAKTGLKFRLPSK